MTDSFEDWAQCHHDDIEPIFRAMSSDSDRALAEEAMRLSFYGGWVRGVDHPTTEEELRERRQALELAEAWRELERAHRRQEQESKDIRECAPKHGRKA